MSALPFEHFPAQSRIRPSAVTHVTGETTSLFSYSNTVTAGVTLKLKMRIWPTDVTLLLLSLQAGFTTNPRVLPVDLFDKIDRKYMMNLL